MYNSIEPFHLPPPARLTVFAGHYGSGKTSLALNYALWLARGGKAVTLCDLDIVNPYFRAADFAGLCRAGGVALVASPYANSALDVPALPPEVFALPQDDTRYGVIDVGGDRGALALGRLAAPLKEKNEYEMLLVVNRYRPLSGDADALRGVRQEIEAASGLPFTALVNNPNLGAETEAAHIQDSCAFMDRLSQALGLPVKMTAARRDLAVRGAFPLEIYEKPAWKVGLHNGESNL